MFRFLVARVEVDFAPERELNGVGAVVENGDGRGVVDIIQRLRAHAQDAIVDPTTRTLYL